MEPVLRRPLTCLSLSLSVSLSLSLSLPHDSLWKIDKCVPRFVCCTKNAKRRRQVRQSNPLAPSPTVSLPLSFLLLLLLLLRWIEFDLIMHKHIWNYCYCYCNVYVCVVCVSVLYMCSLINCRGQDLRRCWPFTRLEFQTENCKHFNIKCTKQQQQQQRNLTKRNNEANCLESQQGEFNENDSE